MTIDELNALAPDAARRALERCCGAARWATELTARRPFRDADHLSRISDEVWWSLGESDWLEAFTRHPRIGDLAVGWAKDEQAGTQGASTSTKDALAALNHEYEQKFGHVFLIFASGRSAEDMLAELRLRLNNEPATELRIAAGEQAKITRLRLAKLLGASLESSRSG